MDAHLQAIIDADLRKLCSDPTIRVVVNSMPGDASNRKYFRLRLSRPLNAHSTIVLMQLASEPFKSEEVTNLKNGFLELPYVNMDRFLERSGIRVPKLFWINQEDGLLYIEDFGDLLLFELFEKEEESLRVEALYKAAVDTLVQIQRIRRDPKAIGFLRSFDQPLYEWEFQHFIDYAIKPFENSGRRRIRVSKSLLSVLNMEFKLISKFLAGAPQCLGHRDYHSKNMMVINENGRESLGFIDFQDALMAPYTYDLVSMLRDAYTPMSDRFEESIYNYYVEKTGETTEGALVVKNKSEFRKLYESSALQRDLKAIGRFFYIDQVKKRSTHLPFVPLTLAKVLKALRRLKELELYPALHEFFEAHADDIKENSKK